MPEPRIKRYALVPTPGHNRVRRFHLARVASPEGLAPDAERLERMEEVAGRDRIGRERADSPRLRLWRSP